MDTPARVLIVDHDPNQLDFLSTILTQQNHHILTATTGQEALQRARSALAIDLIVLDLNLPDMNGHELCRRIKEDPAIRDLPVILISDTLVTEEKMHEVSLRAADYLVKPLSAPEVWMRVNNHLRLSKLMREFQEVAQQTCQQLTRESQARSLAETTRHRIQEGKNALLQLLGTALKPLSLHEQLDTALQIIGALPWLSIQPKGAIFLTDTDGSLILMGVANATDSQDAYCARVAPGQCLCGQAITSRQVIYSGHLTHRPGLTCPGQPGYGHYVLPLLENQRVIGVIRCYREAANEPEEEELDFMEELAHVLGEIISRRLLESRLIVSRYELEKNQRAIINKLVTAAELRDNETGLHILRMSHIATILAARIGLSPEEQEALLATSPMHDVGKIGISDTILLKQGKLSPQEFATMQAHTTIGGQILSGNAPLLSMAREIAQSHHEKWDGTGYPLGLRGEEIPLVGRICAIADVFDALTSDRPYKSAWSVDRAVSLIQEEAGRHFDPKLVEVFLTCLPEILRIREVYGGTDQAPDGSGFVSSLPLSEFDSPLWNDQLLIGVHMIDEQHRYLFKLLHHLEHSLHEGLAILDICRALTELENYMEYHFSNEESFMLRHHYAGYPAHKERHHAFMLQINQLWTTERENTYVAGAKLVAFLKAWLVQHVMREDIHLRTLLESQS